MSDTQTWHHTQAGWGDAAVDGLLAGLAAGVLMAGFLLAAGWAAGHSWDWVLRQFDPGLVPAPLTGAVTHLAVAAVYGLVFGALWRPAARVWRGLPGWLAGLGYGGLLWLVTLGVTTARSAVGSGWLQGFPAVQLAAAHVIFGLALGWLVSRFKG